jgi:hypothetical protein
MVGACYLNRSSLKNFDRQCVQPLVGKILQRIIHKAMSLDAAQPGKRSARNPHPEMGTKTGWTGSGVAGVGCAFIQHFEQRRRQPIGEATVQCVGGRQAGAQGSLFM